MNSDDWTRRDFLATGFVATTALVVGVAELSEDASKQIGEHQVDPVDVSSTDPDAVVPILVGSWL